MCQINETTAFSAKKKMKEVKKCLKKLLKDYFKLLEKRAMKFSKGKNWIGNINFSFMSN